ncbi:DUF1801 domain-containing protein [Virgisporangium aurantiacum]|uniref:YdhG-like domain-containing protein n=1 Tax=Virgisporangium aurantiacum TaxID=175570 RepID=A0A8J3Z8A1_9ACTN|nr:DUF1801 domain-containing protein [Virgisporangium aurantiacum]GIJ57051.1 hypothetical protein Vau01_045670 [Virgisporangium aurantiacum]
MATKPKTTRTDASVAEFLGTVSDPQRGADAEEVCELMREVTGLEPAMWGTSIVGFGEYRYRYASGQEADWPAVALSPRKQALTLYISDDYDRHAELMARLGPHTTGKSCLYIKRLSDIDTGVLRTLIKDGFDHLNGRTVTAGPD